MQRLSNCYRLRRKTYPAGSLKSSALAHPTDRGRRQICQAGQDQRCYDHEPGRLPTMPWLPVVTMIMMMMWTIFIAPFSDINIAGDQINSMDKTIDVCRKVEITITMTFKFYQFQS